MPLNNPISNSDLIAFSDTSGNIVATNVKGALTESAVKITENTSRFGIKPYFIDAFSYLSNGVSVPTNLAPYTDGNYVLMISGIANNNYVTVTGGSDIADAGEATKWNAVVQYDDLTFGSYLVTGTDGINKVYITPNLEKTISSGKIGNLHDSGSGQHYTILGYQALAQHIYNANKYDSVKNQYVKRFNGNQKSFWTNVGVVAGTMSNTEAEGITEKTYETSLTDTGFLSSLDTHSLAIACEGVGKGVEWEVELSGNDGYFECYVGLDYGTDVVATFYQNEILIGTQNIVGKLVRLFFQFQNATNAKIKILSNSASPVRIKITETYWWLGNYGNGNVFDNKKKTVLLGDSWGTYHSEALINELRRVSGMTSVNLINHSAAGMTFKYGKSWFDEFVLAENAEQVIIEYFTNDLNFNEAIQFYDPEGVQTSGYVATIAEWVAGINELIDMCISHGITPIVLMPCPTAAIGQTQNHAAGLIALMYSRGTIGAIKAIADAQYKKSELIYRYTHSLNKEVTVSSVDTETNELVSAGHGYADGNIVIFALNTSVGNIYPFAVFPGGIVYAQYNTYYIVQSSTDRFKLSLTSGGAEIDLTVNAGIDITKWHIERVANTPTFADFPTSLRKMRIIMSGRHGGSCNCLINTTTLAKNYLYVDKTKLDYPKLSLWGMVAFVADVEIDTTYWAKITAKSLTINGTNATDNSVIQGSAIMINQDIKSVDITSIVLNSFQPTNGTIIDFYAE